MVELLEIFGNDSHAQKEIRTYAQEVGDLLSLKFPVSWKALTQHEHSASM